MRLTHDLSITLVVLNTITLAPSVHSFVPTSSLSTSLYGKSNIVHCDSKLPDHDVSDKCSDPHRRMFVNTGASIMASVLSPMVAWAGIDVSSLKSTPPSGGSSSSLADQLKAYDGSASTRVREAKKGAATATQASTAPVVVTTASPVPPGVATAAVRTSNRPPAFRKTGLAGTLSRLDDRLLVSPENPTLSEVVAVSFEYPFDWLQLDRVLGGLEFVDQRNGDKVYVLRADLPPDTPTLETVPKQWFGASIFDPRGSIAKGGNTIEDYKVVGPSTLSTVVGACSSSSTGVCNYTRRRLGMKYATVTGNGLRVERRALVDAYEVDGVAFMLMVTQNAVNFEKKGRERETIEAIADSFRLER